LAQKPLQLGILQNSPKQFDTVKGAQDVFNASNIPQDSHVLSWQK
jgi:hypothetical protein